MDGDFLYSLLFTLLSLPLGILILLSFATETKRRTDPIVSASSDPGPLLPGQPEFQSNGHHASGDITEHEDRDGTPVHAPGISGHTGPLRYERPDSESSQGNQAGNLPENGETESLPTQIQETAGYTAPATPPDTQTSGGGDVHTSQNPAQNTATDNRPIPQGPGEELRAVQPHLANDYGQLGDHDIADVNRPGRSPTFSGPIAIAPDEPRQAEERPEDYRKISLVALVLQATLDKPRTWIDATGRKHPPKLRDAVSYYIKVTRVRNFVLSYCFGKNDKRHLCRRCEELELTYDQFSLPAVPHSSRQQHGARSQKRAGSGQGKQDLGKLETIALKAVWCSFCKLIVNALEEQATFALWLEPRKVVKDQIQGEQKIFLKGITCYARWQIDGHTRRQHPFGAKERRRLITDTDNDGRAVTRRILVECVGSGQHIHPAYIVLLAGSVKNEDGATSVPSDFFGQHVETRHSSVSMMQSWLDRCFCEHKGRCDAEGSNDRNIRHQPYFGVIDLEQWNLAILPENKKYVALSYCWGDKEPNTPPAALTKMSNVRSYRQRGAIERIWNQIPRTIRDSMQLARRLGMRYFWVDSLCIVQDSPHCWQLNANVMDQVYNNAHFTICAADGKNAWEGLRGLTDLIDSPHYTADSSLGEGSKNERNLGRQYTQTIEPYSADTRLMVSYPAEYYINKSKWNTRAWTFQERLLSRRCLIFAEGRVFFQCRSMVLREDIITNNAGGWSIEHRNTPLELLGDVRHRPLSVYTYCVELYTKRELTIKNDILNAFKGVGTYIGKVLGNQGLLYGLPRSHFDWALLWQCSSKEDSKYRGRTDKESGVFYYRDEPEEFPTWSWCGWHYSADFPARYYPDMVDGTMADINDWLKNHTWIQWHIRDGHGNLILVWNPDREKLSKQQSQPLPRRWRGYTVEQDDPRANPSQFDPYGRPMCEESHKASQPGNECAGFKETLEVFPFPATRLETLEEEELFPLGRDIFKLDSMRFLQFKTLTAYFKVKRFNDLKQEHERDPNDRRWAIIDAINEIRGVIIPDRTEWVMPLEREWKVDIPAEYRESVKLGDNPHQFLALSDAKEFSPAEVRDWDTYRRREMEGLQWDLFYVMLVTERRGVYYRMGLGKMEKEAFRYSCQQAQAWKEIILG